MDARWLRWVRALQSIAQTGLHYTENDFDAEHFRQIIDIAAEKERLDGGRWTVPGGWADVNEAPAEATGREIREESGYETRPLKLLALYDRTRHDHPPMIFHCYKAFFPCEIVGSAPATSLETDGVGFFAEDAIPDHLSTGRVTQTQIRRFFQHHRHPDWPTDFD